MHMLNKAAQNTVILAFLTLQILNLASLISPNISLLHSFCVSAVLYINKIQNQSIYEYLSSKAEVNDIPWRMDDGVRELVAQGEAGNY